MNGLKYSTFCIFIYQFLAQWNSVFTSSQPSKDGEPHYLVQTSSGLVQGKLVQGITEKTAVGYYGIPYAQPPIGKLRFLPPEPVQPWSGVFNATEKPVPCYQYYTRHHREESRSSKTLVQRPWSEDCLTLNIWVPEPAHKDAPVLVIIHSGGFSTGSSTFHDGTTMATETVTLVVSMNYRLGPLGFLSFGVPGAPGNVGLLDQQLALKWTNQNIHKFGGKSASIHVIGLGGAGGASAGYHMISKSSSGLFKTVKMFAGSVLCPYAFQDKERSLVKARQVSRSLGCNKDKVDHVIKCLRDVHPEDLLDAEELEFDYSDDQFKPTVDGTFITEPPREAMAAGRFSKVEVILNTNAREGSSILKRVNPDVMSHPEEGITIEGFRKAMKRVLPDMRQSGLEAIEEQYVGHCSLDDPVQLREAAIKAYSNMIMDCCVNLMLDYMVQHGNAVFFNVDDLIRESDSDWQGATHALNVLYIFGYPLDKVYGFNEVGMLVSKAFLGWMARHYLRKESDPPELMVRYNLQDRPYVFWDTAPQNRTHFQREECVLWNEVLPKMMATPSQSRIQCL